MATLKTVLSWAFFMNTAAINRKAIFTPPEPTPQPGFPIPEPPMPDPAPFPEPPMPEPPVPEPNPMPQPPVLSLGQARNL